MAPNLPDYDMFRDTLRDEKTTPGAWITLSEPKIAEIFGIAGFPWVLIDLEHSGISINAAEQHLRMLSKFNTIKLCRPTTRSTDQIRRLLDAGCDGFIVPMVETAADLEAVELPSNFPPKGNRGMGLHPANGFGHFFDDYVSQQKMSPIIIAQIENAAGVQNLDEILSFPGLDGIFLGPYDLSLSLGSPGDFEAQEFKDAIGEVKRLATEKHVPIGIHAISVDINQYREFCAAGFNFIACSLDTKIMLDVSLKFMASSSEGVESND